MKRNRPWDLGRVVSGRCVRLTGESQSISPVVTWSIARPATRSAVGRYISASVLYAKCREMFTVAHNKDLLCPQSNLDTSLVIRTGDFQDTVHGEINSMFLGG